MTPTAYRALHPEAAEIQALEHQKMVRYVLKKGSPIGPVQAAKLLSPK